MFLKFFRKLIIVLRHFPHTLCDTIIYTFSLPIILNLASFTFEVFPANYLVILLFKSGASAHVLEAFQMWWRERGKPVGI